MTKPGYKTSEFWFTLVSFIFSGLFLLGIIGDFDKKEDLIRDVSHGVESCILIGGQLVILYKYINNRFHIKKEIYANDPSRHGTAGTRKSNKPTKRKSSGSKKSSTKRSMENTKQADK